MTITLILMIFFDFPFKNKIVRSWHLIVLPGLYTYLVTSMFTLKRQVNTEFSDLHTKLHTNTNNHIKTHRIKDYTQYFTLR